MDNDVLLSLATQLGEALKVRNLTLALAESCTGGMTSQYITAIAGSSAWFDRGFTTYSNVAKVEMLAVSEDTLATFGAVSEQVATEMATGALKYSHAQVSASITGVAGPSGGSADKPVGTVCFSWAFADQSPITKTYYLAGSRVEIRAQAVNIALLGLIEILPDL